MGLGEGLGTTVNVPLGAGSVDGDYAAVFREIYVPAAKAFRPDLLLVSCGFDAHHQDPLGGIKLTPGAFHHMAHACAVLADRWCGGRLVMALEGGYNHRAVAECVLATLRGLSGGDLPDEACAASPSTTAVLDHLLAHHPLLQGA
jgi:acetoin utilization deacetylase AcuC-like enzyme